MEIKDYPNLLVLERLVYPIKVFTSFLHEATQKMSRETDILFVQGTFVLAVAKFEVMLSDITKYYLRHFPQKISTEFNFSKREFFSNYFDLLEKTIERILYTASYQPFDEYFCKFMDYLSIESDGVFELVEVLQEIVARRNLLLHNDLRVNEKYTKSAGKLGECCSCKGNLKVDYDYTRKALSSMEKIAVKIAECSKLKYAQYTKIGSNKSLWKYMFNSPILQYEDYWAYDEASDQITSVKKCKHESSLASSEKMLLDLWRIHFNGRCIDTLNVKYLDSHNRERVLFFLSIAKDFSFF